MPEELPPDRGEHSLLRARDWQHRPQLDRVCEWWRSYGAGLCALVGIGGAGKTAIADRFLQLLPGVFPDNPRVPKDTSLPAPSRHRVFSFYNLPNPDEFFRDLADWLGLAPAEGVAQVSYQRIVAALEAARSRLLLVLDGLEKVQEDGSRDFFGRITDGRLRDLVIRSARGDLDGVYILLTTRFRLYDPRAEGCAYYYGVSVEELEPDTAVALLRARGVRKGTDPDLRSLAEQNGFHAFSVDLIGGYIGTFCEGDPGLLGPDPHVPEPEPTEDPEVGRIRKQEQRFARIARRYEETLRERDPAALALLQRICLFRLGVAAQTLADIFTGPGKEAISGKALAALDLPALEKKLKLLSALRLLESSTLITDNRQPVTYSVHPAVRSGFLSTLDPDAARQGHEAAKEGLVASLGGLPGRFSYPSDPATLDLLEEIIHHTIEAGHPQEAWDIYWNRIGGFKNLGWRLGAYERGERICRAFARGLPPQSAPLPEGLSENDQAKFINEWALYLKNLGRLDPAARCYERHIELRMRQESWKNASVGNQNLAEVWLLAGRLTQGLRAAEEALRLAEKAEGAEEKCMSFAWRAHARALRGDSDTALDDFRQALHWQHEAVGKTDWPLYSLGGIWQALLLARLGQNDEATRLTEANRSICGELFGPAEPSTPKCSFILADLARERGDLAAARDFVAQAHDWAVARDAKEPLCWAALVRARIALDAVGGASLPRDGREIVGGASLPREETERGPETARPQAEAEAALQEGLRIARECGYGIFHIDLLAESARRHLLAGDAAAAEKDCRLALDTGIHPPEDSGLPVLLAATDPECGYAWGEAAARHLLAEAFLLQAAQNLAAADYVPARLKKLPPPVRKLIAAARTELRKCLQRRKKIRDCKAKETAARLKALGNGILTEFPLEAAPPPDEELDPEPSEAEDMAEKHVFLSYVHENKTKVKQLHDDLIAAGEKVWWDQDIVLGTKGKLAMRQAVKESYAFVLCLSRQAEARAKSGIYPELRDAIALFREYAPGRVFLIPVRLSKCAIPPMEIDATTMLDDLQYVDLFPASKWKAGVNKLVKALQAAPEHP